ncbi:MAG TPA: GMC family oxidoreductase N-terminal domain-containing protein [Anaerolineales bacterium]|nr:GMC family oxidoreductase N-terminal domain-containing protein [Anaerolineales bacterium]
MHFLNDTQFATLTALCDTLVPTLKRADDPHGFWARSAADLGVPRLFTRAVRDLQSPEQGRELKLLLEALGRGATALPLTGQARPFTALSPLERERVLQRWSTSSLPPLRRAFQALKRLTLALYYTAPDASGANPAYAALGYERPAPDPVEQRAVSPIRPLQPVADQVLSCDVVVVGSGAGGGVVAGALAAAGHEVIVIEKGGARFATDFDDDEYAGYQRLYENQAVLTTEDLGITILAGSALGGATTINWAVSFRTPDAVRAEWEREHGVTDLTGAEYTADLDAVSDRIGVNESEAIAGPSAQRLEHGARALGLPWGPTPLNVVGCAAEGAERCGFCTFGCPRDHKRSTLVTYLEDAASAGTRFLTEAHVDRVLIEAGRAVGVLVRTPNGVVTVRARAVAVAAGSLHTPALLLRSGVSNPNLGRHLRLHPTAAMYGDYGKPVRLWHGPMLSRYVSAYTDLDGAGHGVVIEHPPAHPGLLALALPWRSGVQHKSMMARSANYAAFIGITRDTGAGQVTLGADGRPRIAYRLNERDAAHLQRGLEAMFELHVAAGADEIGGPHSGLAPWRRRIDKASYLGRMRQLGLGVNRAMVFSAHQMGTARLGGSPRSSVVDPYGAVWGAKGLYVADAALFPTASGVNPMLTTMALARRVARRITADLA